MKNNILAAALEAAITNIEEKDKLIEDLTIRLLQAQRDIQRLALQNAIMSEAQDKLINEFVKLVDVHLAERK